MTTSKPKRIISHAACLLAVAFSDCASAPLPSQPANHLVPPAPAPISPFPTPLKLQSPRYIFPEQTGTFTEGVHSELKQCVIEDWTNRDNPYLKNMLDEEKRLRIPLPVGYIVRPDSTTIWPFLFLDRDRDGQPTPLNKDIPPVARAYMDFVPDAKCYNSICAQHLQPQKIIKIEMTQGELVVNTGSQKYVVTKLPNIQNGFGCDNLASPPFPWEQIREMYLAYKTSDNNHTWLIAYYPPRQFANGTLEQELHEGLREGMLIRETVPGECGFARVVAREYTPLEWRMNDCVTFENPDYPNNILDSYGYQPKTPYVVTNNKVSLQHCFEEGDELK